MANEITQRYLLLIKTLVSDGRIGSGKDFALKIGVSPSSITEIDKGRTNVGLSAIQKTVTQFPDISLDWLMNGIGEIFKTKSTEKAFNQNEGPNEGFFEGKRKVQKRPSNDDVDSSPKPTHKVTVHGAGAPYAMSDMESSQVNEPDAPYIAEITTDPSLITVDDFAGLTTEEINAEFDGAMQEAVLEMFQAGLIVSGPMVQQMEQRYKEEIRDLTTKLVRLECQHEMVQAELSKLRRKQKRAADEERTGQEKR